MFEGKIRNSKIASWYSWILYFKEYNLTLIKLIGVKKNDFGTVSAHCVLYNSLGNL